MAKKFIAIILAMCLGMSMGLQALAVEYEARIGETDYETFVGAVSDANKDTETVGSVICLCCWIPPKHSAASPIRCFCGSATDPSKSMPSTGP